MRVRICISMAPSSGRLLPLEANAGFYSIGSTVVSHRQR
jgi:hypothetical protein